MNESGPDERFMREALKEAALAAESGEVPVGAVAVVENQIIARAGNRVEASHDAMAHAELLVMAAAERVRGDWRLEDVTIYVTKEPCAMCAGAMVNARVLRVVFGMPDPRSGCAGSALDITGFPGMLHQVQATGGVLEQECRELFRQFFHKIRNNVK